MTGRYRTATRDLSNFDLASIWKNATDFEDQRLDNHFIDFFAPENKIKHDKEKKKKKKEQQQEEAE